MEKRLRSKDAQLSRLKDIAESKGGKLLSTVFITAKTKYEFECTESHLFEMASEKVVNRGQWCQYCAGRLGDFQEKYRSIIEDTHGGKMLSDYVDNVKVIRYECVNGHLSGSTPNNLLAGKFCSSCNSSHGERAVKNYLIENNLSFEEEYRFADCIGKRNTLPFDFAVFDGQQLLCLIEYDGEQHFRPMRHSDKQESNLAKHLSVVENDSIKNKYCLDNDIPLIRISCFDVDYRRLNNLSRDIKQILDYELKKYLC